MVAKTVVIRGEKEFLRKLSVIERKFAPAAFALALNRTATRVRQQVVSDAMAANPRAKKPKLNRMVGVTARASVKELRAIVGRKLPGAPRKFTAVPVNSTPFRVDSLGGHDFHRALRPNPGYRGRGRTSGRPSSSGDNLPIFRAEVVARRKPRKDVRAVLKRSLIAAAEQQMKAFLPGEFRRQLNVKLAKLALKRR